MSLNSPRLIFALTVIAATSSFAASAALGQTKRTFDNSSTPTPGAEQYFDGPGWSAGKWAGRAFPIGDFLEGTQGEPDDLGYFGNPAVAVDNPITLSTSVYQALSVGGWSFNSNGAGATTYSIQAQGTGGPIDVTLGGLNISVSNGEVSGTGSRILVVSDISERDVNIGVSSPQALNLVLGISGTQGEIYVSNGRTMTIGSVISGANKGIDKTGAGTLLLTGSNSYTGLTTVSGGTLRLSATDRISTGGLTVNGATSVFDIQGFNDSVGTVTLSNSGTIDGSGTLTSTGSFELQSGTVNARLGGAAGVALNKSTTGTVVLNGANTYSGLTNISEGVLSIRNSSALGGTTNGTTVASGATLQIENSTLIPISVGAEALTINGLGVGSLGAFRNISGTNIYGGAITLGSTSRISSDASGNLFELDGSVDLGTFDLTMAGVGDTRIDGSIFSATAASSFYKVGSGTLTLTGNNTFEGLTDIQEGTLAVSGGSAIANSATVNVGSGATFQLNSSETIGNLNGSGGVNLGSNTLTVNLVGGEETFSGAIQGTGSFVKEGFGELALLGTNSYSGGTTVSAGALIGNTSSLQGSFGVNGGSTVLQFEQTTDGTFSGDINGDGNFVKSGGGVLTLSGAGLSSGFESGEMHISEGALRIASNFSILRGENFGTLDVASGATMSVTGDGLLNSFGSVLKGSGTIEGLVGVVDGATLAPGNSIGTLTIDGGLELDGIYEFEFQSTGAGDLTAITGNVGDLFLNGATLSLIQLDAPLDVSIGSKFTLFAYSGDLLSGSVFANEDDFAGIWSFNYSDTTAGSNGDGGLLGGKFVTITAVPEPSAALVLGGLLAGAACLRRRRVA